MRFGLDGRRERAEDGTVDMRTASKILRASEPLVAPSSAGSHVDNTSAAEVEATEGSDARGPLLCADGRFLIAHTVAPSLWDLPEQWSVNDWERRTDDDVD